MLARNSALCASYVAVLCAANLSAYYIGPTASVINSFLFIGFDLTARDLLHVRIGLLGSALLVFVAGVASYLLNPDSGVIAVASGAAFFISALADGVTFHLARKAGWLVRSNTSNAVGAAVDSLVFPFMAFGGFYPEVTFLQFLAKLLGGFCWSVVLRKRRN